MTDEEKKATDDLFSLTHINGYINLYDQKKANICTSYLKRWQNGVKVLLNLIKTQQEEIEILKQEKATAWEEWNILNEYCEQEEQKYKAEIEKKDEIINNSINEIERLRQYFSEDLQVEFVGILEILKDKKVIDW